MGKNSAMNAEQEWNTHKNTKMIPDQPIINYISYNDSPRLEYRVDLSDDVKRKTEITIDQIILKDSTSDAQLELIRENIKKSIKFQKPTEYEQEQARDKALFKEPKPYFQIPFYKKKF